MNTHSIVIDYTLSRNKVLLTLLSIGFGISLPRIFHLFGLGHIFLPMFLPTVVTSYLLPLPYLLIAALITPLLSTGLFGMPAWITSVVMCIQLAMVGSIQLALRKTKITRWTITILAIITERLLTLSTSLLIPSLGISSQAIILSYPGIIMLIIAGIITSQVYYAARENK